MARPTQDKIARGNPGKRNEEVDLTREAQPDVGTPPMPEWIRKDKDAREEWEVISEHLVNNKLLTVVDGEALAVYCKAWSYMLRAQRQLEEENFTVLNSAGTRMKNPLFQIINQQTEVVTKMLMHFGLTPLARSKIRFPKGTFDPRNPGGKGESEFEKFAREQKEKREKKNQQQSGEGKEIA